MLAGTVPVGHVTALRCVGQGPSVRLTVARRARYHAFTESGYRALQSSSKQFRLRVALVTAMALLIAQFAAQAHAYSHLRPGSDTTDQLDARGRLCAQCLSFAPLLATAGGTGQQPAFFAPGVNAAPGVLLALLIANSPTLAFRSRAPPRNR